LVGVVAAAVSEHANEEMVIAQIIIAISNGSAEVADARAAAMWCLNNAIDEQTFADTLSGRSATAREETWLFSERYGFSEIGARSNLFNQIEGPFGVLDGLADHASAVAA